VPWPDRAGARLAGVSSFGIAGTNAHVVVAEAPPPADDRAEGEEARPRLLALSARSAEARRGLAAAYRDRLRARPTEFSDVCGTAATRRTHHDQRLAVVARGAEEAADRLDAFLRGESPPGLAAGRAAVSAAPAVAFVFPGQGSQWIGMGRQILAREPVFRAQLEACDEAVRRESGFSVVDELMAPAERSRLDEIDVVQPTLFSVQVGLAALWRSWGVEPRAVVGHSMGEVAAAQVAGILGLEDAAKVICRRSRLLRRVRGRGAMAVVELSFTEAGAALAGYEDRLSVAASNSSRSTVLSGDPVALDEVLGALERQDVFCRRVKVDVASHSPQMDVLREDLLAALDDVRPSAGRVPLYSTVTGGIETGARMDAAYWARNLREPVMFSTMVARLAGDGHAAFVELSAHPILLPAIQQELQHVARQATALPSLRREEDEEAALLESLAALYVLGVDVSWKALHPHGRCVGLPSYPWQRERFWYEGESARERRAPVRAGLLGPHLQSSTDPGAHFWQAELGPDDVPWRREVRVDGRPALPASVWLEMALAAAAEAFPAEPVALSDVTFERALALPDDGTRTVQVAVLSEGPGAASFRISSLEPSGDGGPAWVVHARGTLRLGAGEAVAETRSHADPGSAPAGSTVLSAAEHYQALAARGLHYGEPLRALRQAWRAETEVVARLTSADTGARPQGPVDPVVLDAAFQLLVHLASGSPHRPGPDETVVPGGLERLRVGMPAAPGAALWARARLRPRPAGDAPEVLIGDLLLLDDDGRVVVDARGLRMHKAQRRGGDLDDCFFALEWEAAPRPEAAAPPPRPGRWLVLAGGNPVGGKLASLLEQTGDTVTVFRAAGTATRPGADGSVIDPGRPEELRRALGRAREAGGAWRGIVHLWSLDGPDPAQAGLAALSQTHALGCASVLALVQALTEEAEPPARLWLVTAGAQRAVEGDDVPNPAQAPLWGLGRVVATEHPQLGCRIVDLSGASLDSELRALRDEIVSGGSDDVALRGAARYVARLVRRPPESSVVDVTTRVRREAAGEQTLVGAQEWSAALAEGTTLVTGGLGGLGLTVAGWLVRRGARHLALLGRREPTPAAREALVALERAGATVRVVQGDIADQTQVAHALAEIDRAMPPLRGVVHAAGILDDSTLSNLDRGRLDAVMAPKLMGAWNLHAMTAERPLDLFVLFSSAASLLGLAGQANYAAGNAFLDALAAHRSARGLPALAVAWGPWTEVGLAAARSDRGERLAERGLGGLSPGEGLIALARLLRARSVHAAVMRFDRPRWCASDSGRDPARMLARLAGEARKEPADAAGAAADPLRDRLLAVEPGRPRRTLLESHLRERVGHVLRLAPGRVEVDRPLKTLGLDSLMGLELRNRLEADLGLKLPATLVWNHPTVTALVAHLAERMAVPLDAAADPSTAVAADDDGGLSSMLDEIERLSAEDARRLLAEELPRA